MINMNNKQEYKIKYLDFCIMLKIAHTDAAAGIFMYVRTMQNREALKILKYKILNM